MTTASIFLCSVVQEETHIVQQAEGGLFESLVLLDCLHNKVRVCKGLHAGSLFDARQVFAAPREVYR